jgi:hypothetical protein
MYQPVLDILRKGLPKNIVAYFTKTNTMYLGRWGGHLNNSNKDPQVQRGWLCESEFDSPLEKEPPEASKTDEK